MDNLPKQFGTTGLFYVSQQRHYDHRNGWRLTYNYKGDHAIVDSQASVLVNQGYEVEAERIEGTPKSILRLILSTDADGGGDPTNPIQETTKELQIIWTLNSNVEEKKLEDHLKFQALLNALTETELAGVNKWIEAVLNGSAPTFTPPIPPESKVWDYIFLRERRITSYFATTWELQRRSVVSPRTTFKVDVANTGKVYTTQELDTLTDIPQVIYDVLPDPGHWLKTTSMIEQMADGRFTYTTHWIFGNPGQWRDMLYDLVTVTP